MRLLFVTCHLPYPPFSGGRRREHELLTRLCERFEVEVCAVTKTPAEDARALVDVPWPHADVHLFAAERCRHLAPQVARHGSAPAGQWLARNVHRFDLVHVEGFYLWQHLPADRPPTVLGEQNVEYQLWEQRADLVAARATRAVEQAAWQAADGLVAITTEDRALIAAATGRRDIRLVPDGCDHHSAVGGDGAAPAPEGDDNIVFVGNFAYEPNVDGALWLARDVYPAVREQTGSQLFLVGNAPPPEVTALEGDGITVTGRVPAVEPWLDAAGAVACPLRVGGGIKVKVLEALVRGRAIVATPNCTRGIPRAERALRVAADSRSFADALVEVLSDPAERMRLEHEARLSARLLPSWDDAAASLGAIWEELALAEERAA